MLKTQKYIYNKKQYGCQHRMFSCHLSLSSFCVYYALKHLIKRKSNLQNYNAPNYIN